MQLQSASKGQALTALALTFFKDMGLVEALHLHPGKLKNFLGHMERGYINNPYHNSIHTALVLQVSLVYMVWTMTLTLIVGCSRSR